MRAYIFAMTAASIVAVSITQAQANTTRVVGVIAGVDRTGNPIVQVTSKGAAAQTIQTDGKTAFAKWITHKPWQQDARATASALVEGRCVEVELKPGDTTVAKTIRISDEPSGSIFDPCKTRR